MGKNNIERMFKEIDDWGQNRQKMKSKLQNLGKTVRIVAIDIGASNEGVSLFKKLFDGLMNWNWKVEKLRC